MTRERWECDSCRERGVVQHADDADAWSVVDLLREAHRLTSPDCRRFDLVRVTRLGDVEWKPV